MEVNLVIRCLCVWFGCYIQDILVVWFGWNFCWCLFCSGLNSCILVMMVGWKISLCKNRFVFFYFYPNYYSFCYIMLGFLLVLHIFPKFFLLKTVKRIWYFLFRLPREYKSFRSYVRDPNRGIQLPFSNHFPPLQDVYLKMFKRETSCNLTKTIFRYANVFNFLWFTHVKTSL